MSPKRSYTSAGGTEPVSTEGIAFELDGVTFECHGVFDVNDLTDLASAMMDADETWIDPQALGAVGKTFEQIMGFETYRAFRRHRREHRTPVEVVSQIMLDLIEDINDMDPQKLSASPAGRPAPAVSSSPGASPSPAKAPPRKRRAQEVAARSRTARTKTAAVDPGGVIPPDWAGSGDVITAPPPAGQGQGGATRRVINLGDPARTRVEPLNEAG